MKMCDSSRETAIVMREMILKSEGLFIYGTWLIMNHNGEDVEKLTTNL